VPYLFRVGNSDSNPSCLYHFIVGVTLPTRNTVVVLCSFLQPAVYMRCAFAIAGAYHDDGR
jgi:hypothetical protein